MYLEKAKEVLQIEANGIMAVIEQLDAGFNTAVDLIMDCTGRLVITGIGKSGLIGQKIAATLNSTGTSSLFMHPVEAMHGDLGMVAQDDVILAISNSGETAELNILLPSLKKCGVKIIAMTARADSNLAGFADAVLRVAVPREACPLGLAPTASTTATLAMGDALAVVLIECKKFQESDFRRNHPGGSLGARLKVNVSEIMLSGADIPTVAADADLLQAVAVLNEKNLGAIVIMRADNEMAGIITDGDIRRLVGQGGDLGRLELAEVMTSAPKTIRADLLAADALSIMQRHEITVLPVVAENGRLAGILHLQDMLGKGEFRFLV